MKIGFFHQSIRKNQGRRLASLVTLSGSAINTILVSIQAIILIPIYLHAVGPKLYGAWLGSGEILVWLQVFDLGIPSLIIQRIGAAHGKQDYKAVGEYLAGSILVLAFVALILVFCAVGFSFILPNLMGIVGIDAIILRNCFIVAAVVAAFGIVNNSVIGFSRGMQDTGFLNVTLVISAFAGFGVSLWSVLNGGGLWSIVIGMVVRAIISLLGSTIYLAIYLKSYLGRFFHYKNSIIKEILKISPVTTLGGLSYMLMSQSESTIVAILINPEMAVVMTLTKRAIDVARSIVDSVGTAAYGGFAHLVTSPDREQTLNVHAEIHAFRISIAVSLAAAYIAVNSSLISVWVGPAQFGGTLLTVLIAIQFITTGSSYLMNYLFRATGSVMSGSLMLLSESVLRLPLMLILLKAIGLPGLPIAAIITAVPFGYMAFQFTIRHTAEFSQNYPPLIKGPWIMRCIVFGIGVLLGISFRHGSWPYVLIAGSSVALGSAILFILLDSRLDNIKRYLLHELTKLRLNQES